VRELTVRGVDGAASAGLSPLAAFEDLQYLHLARIASTDLSPLAQLELHTLGIVGASDVDLAPLQDLDRLEILTLGDLRDCRVPDRLVLAGSMRSLSIVNDGVGLSGEPVRRLIDSIAWEGLGELRALQIAVGGGEPLPPIEVDVGWLRQLVALEWLDMYQGILHHGDHSPLEPPFDGLPATLKSMRIDAADPKPLAAALRRHLGRDASVSVLPRDTPSPADRSWTLRQLQSDWITYGSLCEAAESGDVDTERDALRAAKRRLREADPDLLARLDFDQESSGTGIAAPTREDLEDALRILGIR
jgi:hypothetical protein